MALAATTPTSLLALPTTPTPTVDLTKSAPSTVTVPPPPKTPTKAPVISPTYSFMDGSKFSGSGKQIAPPTVVTAKAATTDLANKQGALNQVQTAQGQQTQAIAQNQANAQATPPATPPAKTDTTTTTPPSATDQTNQALQGVQDQADATFASFQKQIASIANGTFPLTPAQQAQVQATQNSYAQLKEAQDLANKNYEGQVRMAGITSGRNQTAPQIDASLVHEAITSGIQKIATIDGEASKAIADLQQGFLDKDYTMINDAYTKASDLFAQKTTAIQDMQKNVQDAATLALQQHTQALAEQKQQLDQQTAARDFAVLHGITKPAYLVGNTAISTTTGLPLSLSEFQQLTGQQVGLPENQTDFSQLETNVTPIGKFTATTDAFGNPITFNSQTGKFEDASGNTIDPSNLSGNTTNPNGVSFGQYGLLAQTDFNPNDQVDSIAQTYLDRYIKSGSIPTASTLGRAIKPAMLAQVAQRASDLYYQATGQPLPTPDIIKSQQGIINTNNTLLNNLGVQEGTITSNFGLNLQNLSKSNLNTSLPIINKIADAMNYALGDPNTAQYFAQNATLQQELGSLLAVKNAGGTTVYDKLLSAGLIDKNASVDQQTAEVKVLLQEALNAKDAITKVNGDLYKQIDPLLQNPNNPLRQQYQTQNPKTLEDYVKANPTSISQINQIHTDHPDLSDQDIIDILTGSPSSLNNEGSGSQNAQSSNIKLGSPLAIANNNPGNLRFTGQPGAIQGKNGFAKFSSPQAGVQALQNQIALDTSRGHTLASFINKYAPPSENNTSQYIAQATKNLGVSANTPLASIDPQKLLKFIALKESSSQIG